MGPRSCVAPKKLLEEGKSGHTIEGGHDAVDNPNECRGRYEIDAVVEEGYAGLTTPRVGRVCRHHIGRRRPEDGTQCRRSHRKVGPDSEVQQARRSK